MSPTGESIAGSVNHADSQLARSERNRFIGTARPNPVRNILVAIASYGRKQDHYLEKVVSEFGQLTIPCKVVVMSEADKPVNGAEVVVGLPSSNTYSLPFAHRRLFTDNANNFDLFIYTEDDTLLTPAHIEAFLDLQGCLKDDEILGFVRSETTPAGGQVITSMNHFFRWLPETVEMRCGELFAEFSNHHSGCFIATRAQLRRAIASGGFMVEPHDEMYGMLESAASDIYRQCGLRRLMCVSRLEEFIVPHLANKYHAEMGVPIGEMRWHLKALRDLHAASRWQGKLFEPETRAFGFQWSKNLYEMPDKQLLAALPANPGRVLSVGVASGRVEAVLKARGVHVQAIALDGVFAGVLREQGIDAIDGTLQESCSRLKLHSFDTVLLDSVLHLVPDPVALLKVLRNFVAPSGVLFARIDNTGDWWAWLRDLRHGRWRRRLPRYEIARAQAVTVRRLRRWCEESGLTPLEIEPLVDAHRGRRVGRILASAGLRRLVAGKLILKAALTEGR